MPTEQVRLSNEAIDALRSYAPNQPLSTAILLMNREVTTSNKGVKQPVTLDEAEWSHFEALFKKYLKQVVTSPVETKVSQFQTAKTYGKIDESEKLTEPIGRQGRDVK
jgi:hypothetical protein